MKKTNLSIGLFEIHLPEGIIKEKAEQTQRLIREHQKNLKQFMINPEDESVVEEFVLSAKKYQDALERLWEEIKKTIEYPQDLPFIVKKSFIANIISKALDINFEILDHEIRDHDAEEKFYTILGRIIDSTGQEFPCQGTSFPFNPNSEEEKEGAFLMACISAFVTGIFDFFAIDDGELQERFPDIESFGQ